MRGSDVRVVVFAHGSFVGDDPIAVARTVEDAVPVLPDIGHALRGVSRSQVSFIGGFLHFGTPRMISGRVKPPPSTFTI